MSTTDHFEARLSKVEASVESIIRDLSTLGGNVKELATIVRSQGEQTEEQLKTLLVGVATAAGPRKTDWQLVLAAVGLVLALGMAAFTPMNMRIVDLKSQGEDLNRKIESHINLPMHPVSQTRIDALERALIEKQARLDSDIKALDMKLQQETKMIAGTLELAISNLDMRLQREIGVTDTKANKAFEYSTESRMIQAQQVEKLNSLMEKK